MAAPATLTHLFTELASLDDLGIPLTKGSARLRYTCMCVSHRYICLGSNTGGVYVFSRDSLKHLQIVFGDVETSPVTAVAISPNDLHLGFAVSSGQVVIMELNIERRTRPERVRQTADHLGSAVTAMAWDGSGSGLFVGDNMGKVTLINVPSSKAKTIFTQPSQTIVRLESSVYQLDWWGGKLLVSTLTRTYLLNTVKQQFSQIGQKTREGEFGSCFFLEPSSNYPVIYCARPGSRMWEVDFEGNVLNTHQFKQLLATQPLPIIKPGVNLEKALHSPGSRAQSVNFQKMFRIGEFILTWSSQGVHIFDPINVKVVLWTDSLTGIKDISLLKNEVYVLLESQVVRRLVFLPLFQLCSALVTRQRCTLAADLLLYMEHFALRPALLKRIKRELLALLVEFLKAELQLDLMERVQTMLEEVSESSIDSTDSQDDGSEKSMYPQFSSGTSGIIVVNDGSMSVLDFDNYARSRGTSPTTFKLVKPPVAQNGVLEARVSQASPVEAKKKEDRHQHHIPQLSAHRNDQPATESSPQDDAFISILLTDDGEDAEEAADVNQHVVSGMVMDGVSLHEAFTDLDSVDGLYASNASDQKSLSEMEVQDAFLGQRCKAETTESKGLPASCVKLEDESRGRMQHGNHTENQLSMEDIAQDKPGTADWNIHGDKLSTAVYVQGRPSSWNGAELNNDMASADNTVPVDEVPLQRINPMPHLKDMGDDEAGVDRKDLLIQEETGEKPVVSIKKDSSGSDAGLVERMTKKIRRRHVNVIDIPAAESSSGVLKKSFSTGALKQKKKKELRRGRSLDSSPERIDEDDLYAQTDADPETVSIATISSIEEEESLNDESAPLTPNLGDDAFSAEEHCTASGDAESATVGEQLRSDVFDDVHAADAISNDGGLSGVSNDGAFDSAEKLNGKSASFSVGSSEVLVASAVNIDASRLENDDDDDSCDDKTEEVDTPALLAYGENVETEVVFTGFPADEGKLDQHLSAESPRYISEHSDSISLTETLSLNDNLSLNDTNPRSSFEKVRRKSLDDGREVIPPLIARLSAMGVARMGAWGEEGAQNWSSQDVASMRDRLTGVSKRGISTVKDRVTKIRSTTQSLIRRVKEKNPLVSKSPSSSPPFLSAMVSGSPSSQSGHKMGSSLSSFMSQGAPDPDSQEFPNTTVSIDLSPLLSKTRQTQEELNNPSFLLNQEKLHSILNSWALELNKTLFALHQEMNAEALKKKREELAQDRLKGKVGNGSYHPTENEESESLKENKRLNDRSVDSGVSDSGYGDLGTPVDPAGSPPSFSENPENQVKNSPSGDSFNGEHDENMHFHAEESHGKVKDKDGDSVMCNGLSTIRASEQKSSKKDQSSQEGAESVPTDDDTDILTDWEQVCHVQDPFHLTPQQHNDMSTIAAHCFDCGCFGNIQSVFSSSQAGPKTISTSPQSSSSLSGTFANSFNEGDTTIQLQDGKVIRKNVAVSSSSSTQVFPNSHLKPSRKSSSSQLVPSGTSYAHDANEKLSSGKDSKMDPGIQTLLQEDTAKIQGLVADSGKEIRIDGSETVDEERAMFLCLFYHFLSLWRIRRLLAGTEQMPVFKTWCSLIRCCQALGTRDIVYMKIGDGDVTGSLDYLRSGILPDKSAFLGHISSLFALAPMRVADFAAEIPRQVTLHDLLHLCHLHGKSQMQVLTRYLTQRLGSTMSHLRSEMVKQLAASTEGRLAVLECLLSLRSSQLAFAAAGKTRHAAAGDNSNLSPEVINEVLDTLLSLVRDAEVAQFLPVCWKFRYWPGCLQLLIQTDQWERALQLEVELDDISLLDGSAFHGFCPRNVKEWKHLLQLFKRISLGRMSQQHSSGELDTETPSSDTDSRIELDSSSEKLTLNTALPLAIRPTDDFSQMLTQAGETLPEKNRELLPKNFQSPASILSSFKTDGVGPGKSGSTVDRGTQGGCRLTWMGLGFLAAQQLGAKTAVELLQQCCGADDDGSGAGGGGFSDEFYCTCIALSSVERQQRLVIHNMLEKVDSYLWAKKPTHLPPQVHYAVSREKTALQTGSADNYYQNLFARLASVPVPERQLAEDPDCHWGVNTSIIRECAACQISVTETVSHLEPGVYIFRCGHIFHKFCAPDKLCPLC